MFDKNNNIVNRFKMNFNFEQAQSVNAFIQSQQKPHFIGYEDAAPTITIENTSSTPVISFRPYLKNKKLKCSYEDATYTIFEKACMEQKIDIAEYILTNMTIPIEIFEIDILLYRLCNF